MNTRPEPDLDSLPLVPEDLELLREIQEAVAAIESGNWVTHEQAKAKLLRLLDSSDRQHEDPQS